MLPTKPMRITVKAPRGIKFGDVAVKKAQAAAQAVVDHFGSLYKSVADLNAQGISITLEELLSRSGAKAKAPTKRKKARRKPKVSKRKAAAKRKAVAKPKAEATPKAAAKPKVASKPKARRKKSKGKSRRTVLSADQRKSVTDRLQAGATAAKVAAEFGVSPATVNNIKRAAGLTKPRRKVAKK